MIFQTPTHQTLLSISKQNEVMGACNLEANFKVLFFLYKVRSFRFRLFPLMKVNIRHNSDSQLIHELLL